MSQAIQFLLNNEEISLEKFDPNLTVLQYLREIRYQSGSKEGCASGDCGACTVVIAELSGNSSLNSKSLNYKSVNACISFIGSLHGKQLITIEHLKPANSINNKLHQVQQAFVDNHASQCGFCTPGFVMSSFALLKQKAKQKEQQNSKKNQDVSKQEVAHALAGNLCRCTGYKSIVAAAMEITNCDEIDDFTKNEQQTIAALQTINLTASIKVTTDNNQYFAPKSADELAQLLIEHPQATLVAGGTDLALSVTQQAKSIAQLVYLGNVAELNQLSQSKEQLVIGAAVPYSKFTYLLAKPFPELATMIARIGSMQIRNLGTLGGNVGNASPIGDMPPALIALSASLTLQKGQSKRKIAVEDYFKDYKVTDLAESEFIRNITIPKLNENQQLKVYKISKRLDDDISAVLAALCIELSPQIKNVDGSANNKQQVKSIKIAFGGMAEIPKRALLCEQALQGKVWQQSTIDAAKQVLHQDFQPMSDVRASSEYRMMVAQNLLQKCFIELNNDSLVLNKQQIIATQVVDHA
ncbi:MAG: xanthine dehydrogenase small subunit [Gammaproteobacteria bacterium]|nr:MAG: xanthine dehydrogenase small subunit [Gammaproteobacteria bacterium]